MLKQTNEKEKIMFEEEIQVLKALANGVNYFTGEKCSEDSVLNDGKIVRVLFNLCDKLKNAKIAISKKLNFEINQEMINNFPYEDRDITLTSIINKLTGLAPNMKRLSHTQVFEVLSNKGLLVKNANEKNELQTQATELAKQYGIFNVERISPYGKPYQAVVYNRQGQAFVLTALLNDTKN